MKTVFLSAVLIALFIFCNPARGQASTHSSIEDRQRFVTIVQNLERAPLDPELQDDRAWAVRWLIDAPDISVTACLEPLGDVSEKTYARASIVIAQYSIAMGAFIINNPDKSDDFAAQQLAGVESALASYKALRTVDSIARSPALERLLAIEKRGNLANAVRKAYQSCPTENSEQLSLTANPSESVMWETIWDEPEIAVIYADRSSVKGSGDLRSVITRTIYRAPLPEGNISERVRMEEFDCMRHKSKIRRVTILTNDGHPSQTVEWAADDTVWQTYESGSLGAEKSRIACAATKPAK